MYKNYKIILKRQWRWLVLVLVIAIFFIGTSSFILKSQAGDYYLWSSPDEKANYVFSKLYGQTGEMTIFEKYNLVADDTIHPRSLRSDDGNLKPVSFLGIILIYGSIVSLTSYKILPFLTPMFASIGILFFYFLIKELFGRKNALYSTLLLASFPPYIYYTARSMFHNVLFTVLLIVGLYFSILMIRRKRLMQIFSRKLGLNAWFYAALGGLFLGLSFITRTSELIWLLPMLLILWLFNIRKVGITKLIIFLSFLFLALLPMLHWNQILYDSPVKGGYPEMNNSIASITGASVNIIKSSMMGELAYNKKLLGEIKENIFYFGLNIKQSIRMFYYYFISMFYWLFWPGFFGLLLFIQKAHKWKKKHLVYILAYSLISAILIFYYGSWVFYDNPDPDSFTIGNSYTRYWLPIYLGAMPLVSMFLIRFTRNLCSPNHEPADLFQGQKLIEKIKLFFSHDALKTKRMFWANIMRTIIIIIIFFTSIRFVVFGSDEGLLYTIINNQQVREEKQAVLEITEGSSVIITQYHDKVLFPDRKVIVGLFNDDEMNTVYAKLVDELPVYYYNFTLPEKDLDYLNNTKLEKADLSIAPVQIITNDFTLYRLGKNE